jgi:2-phospho-L-lactate/phosphoenolpyruvate guanylyltransferase
MRAIVPLKQYASAKQRLAGALSPDERRGLMQAMVTDVLEALREVPRLDGILLVSREPDAARLADEFAVELFAEPARADLSEAVQAAGGYLLAHQRATGTMIVPADVPLASADDFNAVLAQHRELTLVPDDDGDGTNCIVSSPPNLIRYQFDGHSFRPHVEAAYAIGITPGICRRPNLGLDIDTPADLARLVDRAADDTVARHTIAFLRRHGVASRLCAADRTRDVPRAAGHHDC